MTVTSDVYFHIWSVFVALLDDGKIIDIFQA